MLSLSAPTEAQAARALILACQAVIAAVKEAGDIGAPAGVMYSALMGTKMTLGQFQQILDALVRLKKLHRKGHLYFWVADL